MGEELAGVAENAARLAEIQATLDPKTGSCLERQQQFQALSAKLNASADPVRQHMAKTMESFAPGLFAGGDDADLPGDNLDLERSFRLPKGHERHIHGHAHAGVRIVHHGPSLLLVLDAHLRHPEPFSSSELLPWIDAPPPAGQRDCRRRRRIMRLARSAKKRPLLLADLERRWQEVILAA